MATKAKTAKKKVKAGSKSRPLPASKPKAAKPAVAPKAVAPIKADVPPKADAPASKTKPDTPVITRPRPRDLRDMNRGELEDYAKEVGLLPRALELSDDRLRQNIMAFLMHTRE